MKTLINFTFIGVIFVVFSTQSVLAEYDWLKDSMLKISIETEEEMYEWEFENPDEFEYEKGDMIWRGEKAKRSFEDILALIDLSEPELSETVINDVSKHYTGIKRLTIKRERFDQPMQTWVWNNREDEKAQF
ncbi:hypothetical protein [Salipaludibacillus daqingensis]|uniref:hypothetical protein n=1 Tax=Salipaludibacillus daqingensis TaxID=3041001 RepID=UPI002474ACF0|nr:hypothetical protein [Salipaludibacillus daqingensis]